MLNHPDKIPQGTVSYYDTELIKHNPVINKMFNTDKTILRGNSYEFEEREID